MTPQPFVPGQQVICVDASSPCTCCESKLRWGAVYTVDDVRWFGPLDVDTSVSEIGWGITLCELSYTNHNPDFFPHSASSRFRPMTDPDERTKDRDTDAPSDREIERVG